jgi:hypothetical protein
MQKSGSEKNKKAKLNRVRNLEMKTNEKYQDCRTPKCTQI